MLLYFITWSEKQVALLSLNDDTNVTLHLSDTACQVGLDSGAGHNCGNPILKGDPECEVGEGKREGMQI